MTIGIGVLCSTQPSPYDPRPDALVMIADTMGSTETDSTGELHKMLFDPDHRLFAVCAGRIEVACEIFPLIREELAKISGPRVHGAIWRALNIASNHHRQDHFAWDVLNHRFSFGGQVLPPDQENIQRSWRDFDVGAPVILGTFDDDGRALLYYLGAIEGVDGLVHLTEFPGCWSIGTGCYNANVWLNYRRQKLSLNIQQSALHAYEASRMASSAPTVNHDIEVLVATTKGSFHFSREQPSPQGCPVSLPWLMSMAKRYGPRNTDPLGFQKGTPT